MIEWYLNLANQKYGANAPFDRIVKQFYIQQTYYG